MRPKERGSPPVFEMSEMYQGSVLWGRTPDHVRCKYTLNLVQRDIGDGHLVDDHSDRLPTGQAKISGLTPEVLVLSGRGKRGSTRTKRRLPTKVALVCLHNCTQFIRVYVRTEPTERTPLHSRSWDEGAFHDHDRGAMLLSCPAHPSPWLGLRYCH